MANDLLVSLSTDQLRRALSLKEQIAALETQLNQMFGAPAPAAPTAKIVRRRLSAATRAKMAAAAKARWAKKKAAGGK